MPTRREILKGSAALPLAAVLASPGLVRAQALSAESASVELGIASAA